MTTTAALVNATPNRLRYLLSYDGADWDNITLTSTGAASPDLVTDSVAGPIKNLANAHDNGFGSFAAGALTQAQSRALWLSDDSGADPGLRATARVTSTIRTGLAYALTIDANVSGGEATVVITTPLALPASAHTWYVDIEVPGVIGY